MPQPVNFATADVQALEDFFDSGAGAPEAQRLAHLFEFRPRGRQEEGATFKWRRYTVPDLRAAEELTPERVVFTATHDVIVRLDKQDHRVDAVTPAAILEDYRLDPVDYIDLPDELADFWAHPTPLYHATTVDHVEDILEDGLRPRNATRGLRNRGVGAAVFTTSNPETTVLQSYGDVVFEIDTAAMARDGYTPEVAQEPDVVEAAALNALAWAFGIEDYAEEPENAPDTVIVYGSIPPEYLRRLGG